MTKSGGWAGKRRERLSSLRKKSFATRRQIEPCEKPRKKQIPRARTALGMTIFGFSANC
jgi:hypothetical protein